MKVGYKALLRLKEILGLPKGCERVIIDVQARGIVKFYTQNFITQNFISEPAFDSVMDLLVNLKEEQTESHTVEKETKDEQ